ncbi:hypothetical protein B0H19DRAFT_1076991 [Mycena capillaripes]|nr:hypothetical protein B0H19DRAFT_1076991 [Mycena capillaripes]
MAILQHIHHQKNVLQLNPHCQVRASRMVSFWVNLASGRQELRTKFVGWMVELYYVCFGNFQLSKPETRLRRFSKPRDCVGRSASVGVPLHPQPSDINPNQVIQEIVIQPKIVSQSHSPRQANIVNVISDSARVDHNQADPIFSNYDLTGKQALEDKFPSRHSLAPDTSSAWLTSTNLNVASTSTATTLDSRYNQRL